MSEYEIIMCLQQLTHFKNGALKNFMRPQSPKALFIIQEWKPLKRVPIFNFDVEMKPR